MQVWMTHWWLSCVIKNEALCLLNNWGNTPSHPIQSKTNKWGVHSLSLTRCNLISLSSGVSTVNLPCWLVLVHCNLVSLFSEVSAIILSCSFHCKLACLSLAVWTACLAQSLSLCSTVSAAHQASSLSLLHHLRSSTDFLLLCWFESSSRTALGIQFNKNYSLKPWR